MQLNELIDPGMMAEVRRIELRTRRSIDADLMGQYRSSFRGSGLVFSDLREYTAGDDVKHIHWKASARSGKVYIKSYEEDRQLNIILALDVSRSTDFGTEKSKHRKALEFCALIALLANVHQDAIGLCTFSDQVEEFIAPKRAKSQIHRLILSLLSKRDLKPSTNISNTLRFLHERQKRSSIIFIVSDFISPDYQQELTMLSLHHDVVLVMLEDRLDRQLPNAGLIEFVDAESGEKVLIDSSNSKAVNQLINLQDQYVNSWQEMCTKTGVDYMRISDNAIRPLVQLMNRRTARIR